MRKIIFYLLALSIFANSAFAAPSADFVDQQSTVSAIKKVLPAVVSISIVGDRPSGTLNFIGSTTSAVKERVMLGSGTGFIVSANGIIITNKHVVSIGDGFSPDFRVTMANGKKYYAQLIGKDPVNDLAVLKIFDDKLPYVQLGDSKRLELGQTAIAIGNSLGVYANSVTKGVVSGLHRSIFASDNSNNALESLSNVIQTDAEINLGNSGGPLIDLDGKVIGVNVATDISGKSIGFAIPINEVRPIIKSALREQRIVRPRLGVRYVTINSDTAEIYGLKEKYGALIKGGEGNNPPAVVPDSPAAKAGLRDGDIILEIDGKKITEDNPIMQIMSGYLPGKKIGLKIKREGKMFSKILVLDAFPPQ